MEDTIDLEECDGSECNIVYLTQISKCTTCGKIFDDEGLTEGEPYDE